MSSYKSVYPYIYGLVPGPTSVPEEIRKIYALDFPSPDIENTFFVQYENTCNRLAKFLGTSSDIVIMSGEAMVCLWGCLKSTLKKGDRVLAIDVGVFGKGIGEMAKSIGCEVEFCHIDWKKEITDEDIESIAQKAKISKPSIITTVHCDTPTGWINSRLSDIGKIAKNVGALYFVDFVSSFGGVPLNLDDLNVDLGVFGSQKCLNCPPDFGIVSVSPKAWDSIEKQKYCGYDALLPFKNALAIKFFDSTPSWRAVAAIDYCLDKYDEEGHENVYKRHMDVRNYCIQRLHGMGLQVYVEDDIARSPTATACLVPPNMDWKTLDRKLRESNVVLGGTFGEVENLLFRVGHMGIQANMELVKIAMDNLEQIIKDCT